MKKDKKNELQNKSVDELKGMAQNSREHLERMMFNLKSGKTANIKEIREAKKEIATILTIIHQHERNNNKK